MLLCVSASPFGQLAVVALLHARFGVAFSIARRCCPHGSPPAHQRIDTGNNIYSILCLWLTVFPLSVLAGNSDVKCEAFHTVSDRAERPLRLNYSAIKQMVWSKVSYRKEKKGIRYSFLGLISCIKTNLLRFRRLLNKIVQGNNNFIDALIVLFNVEQ
jgi:hypothetical protein